MYLCAIILGCAHLWTSLALPLESPSQEDNPDPLSGDHKWIPASKINGASRTSCPFLNTAANHGFLPRDGRRVSIAQFEQAIVSSLNFKPEFAHIITTKMLGNLGALTNNTATDANLRLDLEQTSRHNKTEHDASITRLDQSQGDPIPVRPYLVQQFLDDTVPSSYPYINTSTIGRTRVRREHESLALGNPPLRELFVDSSQGQAGLILTIMADDTGPITAESAETRKAPKERVKAFLLEERFPTDLGWKRPGRVIEQKENVFVVQSVAKWQAIIAKEKGSEKPKNPGGDKERGYR